MRRQWKAELAAGARHDPRKRFPSPPHRILLERLDRAARIYGFTVLSVSALHPVQAAPLVVVQADERGRFARDVPAILRLIDPRTPTPRKRPDDRLGWAYEGFFLEARNSRGVPILITFNHWRGASVGGGQWAAREDLYPFEHL